MSLEEIQRVRLSPTVDIPFSLNWSEDNKISLNMEKGLLVLDFVPDTNSTQKGFYFHRSWIAPAEEMPTEDVGIKVNELYWNLQQQNLHHLIEDIYLAPKLNTTTLSPPYITQVAWSPQGMLCYGRCLLATLTNYGCVLVQAPRGKYWYSVANISFHWKEYCSESWIPPKNEKADKQFYELQDRVAKLRITCITWSDTLRIETVEMGYFIAGMQNGNVAVWQLNVAQNYGDVKLDPKLVLVFNSGLKRISAMLWSTVSHNKAYLWLGDVQGSIKMFTFCISGLEIRAESSLDLWSGKELLRVCKFLILSATETSQMLLAVKETFLFAFLILDNTITVRSELIGNLAIYGIEKLNEETVLLAAYSASLKKIRVLRSKNEVTIESENITHDGTSDYGYYGLAASKNKVIWVLSASVCKPYDHLVLREPAQILFFTFPGSVESYEKLLNNPVQSLANHWDCLELIRLQGTAMSYLGTDINKLESMDTYQLKITLWFTKFALQNENTEEEKCSELQKQLEVIYRYIILQHMCKLVHKLRPRMSNASKLELDSLFFMCYWLHKASADSSIGERTKSLISKALEAVNQAYCPMKEECAICKTKIMEHNNPTEVQCPLGHIIPRCSICFVHCSELPYWLCQVCGSIACKDVELVQQPVCIYCDSSMCLDGRLLT